VLILVLGGILLAAEPLQPAPDFSLKSINADSLTLSALQGQDLLLIFGTTRCPHCEAALPVIENLTHETRGEMKILFIAIRQNAQQVRRFFDGQTPPYDILIDINGQVSKAYDIKRVPTCVFIDGQGLIQYTGPFNQDIIWRLLSGERPIYTESPPISPWGPDARADRPAPDPKTKRLIVELDEDPAVSKTLPEAAVQSRQAQFHRAAGRIGGRIIHNYGKLKNKIVIEIPTENTDKLKELPLFKSFKEDRRVYALLEDSVYQINADYAWDNAITGEGVKVCVVDTGIDYTHPDLLNKVIAQYNATNGTDDAMDDCGHGTHCAGIIASEGRVYRGVSHDVALMAAKVLDHTGAGYASDVILGIEWCVEQGADIISLSLGEGLFPGTCDFDEMAQAVNHAVDPCGVVVVCAAGNDGNPNAMVAPACASKAIAVGALAKTDFVASYSDGGPELDVVAPGGDLFGGNNYPEIVSTYSTLVAEDPRYCLYLITDECWDYYFVVDGTRYIRAAGTSMATPHVAGAAALLLEENPYLTAAQVRATLEQNADDLGVPGWDNVYGWGKINIQRALENIPPEPAELKVNITEPNATDTFTVAQEFTLQTTIDCFGADGCGEVLVHAQFCQGRDCNDFVDINSTTPVSTTDNNPNDLGVLSGYTIQTDVNVIFDAQTVFDISEQTYTKSLNPTDSLIGSTLPAKYNTGDLEPQDGIGAIGQDAQKLYEFAIPSGKIQTFKVRMENYLVLHFDYPPFAGWYVYTSDANANELHLVADCIPAEGGGGETPSPDCWFISDDPNVPADLIPGATNYFKLVSHDVGDNDWITFNDIEAIIEYEIDPNNDEVYQYYIKFDLSEIDPLQEPTAARLKINVTQEAQDSTAELRLVDNTLLPADPAQTLHEANSPSYSDLINPIKTFSGEDTGTVTLNIKAAVEEALVAGQNAIAFKITELNNDQLFAIDANNGLNPPILTISQKVPEGYGTQPPGEPSNDPNNGPRTLTYDTEVVKDVNDDTYVKYDNPDSAVIGAPFASEYNTGDLEPQDGIGAIGSDAQKLYEFQIPAGLIKTLKVRMENYLVMHFDYPPFAGWYVYTSNADGNNLHLVADCIPAEGGGGATPSPDCWFVSDDPNVLDDLNPGGTNYIKLVSHDVGANDWITFNDIEVIAEYQIDPDNDNIHRYYMKFDIAALPGDAQIDSAKLNLYVTEPNTDAVAEVSLVHSAYDPCTAGHIIFNAQVPAYSPLINPIKTFAADTTGLKQVNVKTALEDAIAADAAEIAFLISEENQDTLFSVGAGSNEQPPSLNVYLESDASSGTVKWNIRPNASGYFTLRVLASNNVGVTGLSDALVLNVRDPNLPVINVVACLINDTWQDCRVAQYGDNLRMIAIDATDPQETPNVWLTLRNVPDDHNFVDDQVAYSGAYFIHDTNLVISDSGQWQIQVRATDSDQNSDTKTINWNIPWGALYSYFISPTTNVAVPKSGSFNVYAGTLCLGAECPDVEVGLALNEPVELKYDDATAENYGEIGSTSGYLAVKFQPAAYPAQLKTARFYVWDETAYPFEIRVWDDNTPLGKPGTDLIAPFIVDPVVSSAAQEVAWFDIDLSDHNIIINEGQFYIGYRQLEGTKNNQVGFDMPDDPNKLYGRSWGYLPALGWFNLHGYCLLCDPNLPFFCDYCGNLMVRAITSEPQTYSGELPETIGPAILYTLDDNPSPCPNSDLDPGETCEAAFKVYAVGPTGDYARLHIRSANNYSAHTSNPIAAVITQPQTPCDAANLDAIYPVGPADLAVLAQQWLQTAPPLIADINADRSVNFKDLARLALYWLQTCD
jgi:subtilisin family serine protease